MKAWSVSLLGPFLLFSSCASPVSWGNHRTLLSQERTTRSGYSLKAASVTGRLNIRQDMTYSLTFEAGRVSLGDRTLRTGCAVGQLKSGAALNFQGARRVTLYLPSRGCPAS